MLELQSDVSYLIPRLLGALQTVEDDHVPVITFGSIDDFETARDLLFSALFIVYEPDESNGTVTCIPCQRLEGTLVPVQFKSHQ